MTDTHTQEVNVADLRAGDILHSLPNLTISPSAWDNYTIVTAPTAVGETSANIHTCYAVFTTAANANATIKRPTQSPILLIGRRNSMHSRLLGFGEHVIRRTPVTADTDTPAVTAQEWDHASLILVDGYLGQETLRNMWDRDEFTPIDKQIILIGDDPDDARYEGRARAAYASGLAVLPYSEVAVHHLLHSVATGQETPAA